MRGGNWHSGPGFGSALHCPLPIGSPSAGRVSPHVLHLVARSYGGRGPPDYLGHMASTLCPCWAWLAPERSKAKACVLGTAPVPFQVPGFVKTPQGGGLEELSCLAGDPISLTSLLYTPSLSPLESL